MERSTWAIDDSTFLESTVDFIVHEGQTYSSKPPMMPLIGAVIYGVTNSLTSWTFVENPVVTTTVVRLFLQILPFALFLFFFWRFLGHWMTSERARVWIYVTVALGSYVFGYSSKLNNHAPAAFLLFGAFFAAYLVARLSGRWWWWLVSGLMAGLAVTFDLGAGPFLAGLGIYLLFVSPWRTLALFGVAATLPLALNLCLNVEITGNPIPFYLQSELYHFPGSYWDATSSYDALDEPKWLYLFHMTFGHHGWFSMSPILLLGFGGTVLLWSSSHRREAILSATVAAFVFIYYWLMTSNYGGGCGSMRWLIVTFPLWMLPVAKWLDVHIESKRRRWLYVGLAVVGALHALPLVWDPWTRSPWHRLFQLFGLGSI